MILPKSKRYYLDHNATTSLSQSFIDALSKGQVPVGNPSSNHTAGKETAKAIKEVKDFLYRHFMLDEKTYNVVFHSGATEAANTFFQLQKGELLAYFSSDHSCIREQRERLSSNGVESIELSVEKNGAINPLKVIETLKGYKNKKIYLHVTQMNNEVGSVVSLADISQIKLATGCIIYVDAVQTPGKVRDYNHLRGDIDIYTYSGHKFGALKGIGFSFVRSDFSFRPLILGGGQQSAMRSGTINSQGIISLRYALEELVDKYKADELERFKNDIIAILESNSNIFVIENNSLNTISFLNKKLRADAMLIHFDLAGLDVSSGSACSSGSVEASHVISAIGHKDLASNHIRLSLGHENLNEQVEILEKIQALVLKF